MALTEDDDFAAPRPLLQVGTWVSRIEDSLAAVAEMWNLIILEEIDSGLVAYSVSARRRDTGELVFVKLREPNTHMRRDVAALQLLDGRASVRLLASDADIGALMLEYPGSNFAMLSDCMATDPSLDPDPILIDLFRELWRVMPSERIAPLEVEVRRWINTVERVHDERTIGRTRLRETAKMLSELLDSQDGWTVFLHGNLETMNVLTSTRGWIARAPRGLVGEREFDVGWWLREPPLDPHVDPHTALRRRLDMAVDLLGVDRERTLTWARCLCIVVIVARSAAENSWGVREHSLVANTLRALA